MADIIGSTLTLLESGEEITQIGEGSATHPQSGLKLSIRHIYTDWSFYRVILENGGGPWYARDSSPSFERIEKWTVWVPVAHRPQWGKFAGLRLGAQSGGLQDWIILNDNTSFAWDSKYTDSISSHGLGGRRSVQIVFCKPGFQQEAPTPVMLDAFREFIGYDENGSGYPEADALAASWGGDASAALNTNQPRQNLAEYLHHPVQGHPAWGHPFQLGASPSADAEAGGGNWHNAAILNCLKSWACTDNLEAYQLALLGARHKATMGWVLPGDGSLWESWADKLFWFEKTNCAFPGANFWPYMSHSWVAGIIWCAAFSGDPLLAKVGAETVNSWVGRSIWKPTGSSRKLDRVLEGMIAAGIVLGDESILAAASWALSDAFKQLVNPLVFSKQGSPMASDPWQDAGVLWRGAQLQMMGKLDASTEAHLLTMTEYLAESCVEDGYVAYAHRVNTGWNDIRQWPSINGFVVPLLWWLAKQTGKETHKAIAVGAASTAYENMDANPWQRGHAIKKNGQLMIGYHQKALREIKGW